MGLIEQVLLVRWDMTVRRKFTFGARHQADRTLPDARGSARSGIAGPCVSGWQFAQPYTLRDATGTSGFTQLEARDIPRKVLWDSVLNFKDDN